MRRPYRPYMYSVQRTAGWAYVNDPDRRRVPDAGPLRRLSTSDPALECRRNPHASSFTRHLEGLRPVSPLGRRCSTVARYGRPTAHRMSRRLESRGRNGEIEGASTPRRRRRRQKHSTFTNKPTHLPPRASPLLPYETAATPSQSKPTPPPARASPFRTLARSPQPVSSTHGTPFTGGRRTPPETRPGGRVALRPRVPPGARPGTHWVPPPATADAAAVPGPSPRCRPAPRLRGAGSAR